MVELSVLVVLALAAFRVTRLVTDDTITAGFRDKLYDFAWDDDNPVVERNGDTHPSPRGTLRTWVYELFTCPWCLGVWIAVATYSAWRWGDNIGRSIIAVAAIAGAQGAVAAFVQNSVVDTKATGAEVEGRQ